MTDKNGKPLKVGDKVISRQMPVNCVGEVYSIGGSYVNVKFDPREITLCDPRDLVVFDMKVKRGDKVTHCERPEHTGVVEDTGATGSGLHWANVMFDDGIGWLGCDMRNLTLVEPERSPFRPVAFNGKVLAVGDVVVNIGGGTLDTGRVVKIESPEYVKVQWPNIEEPQYALASRLVRVEPEPKPAQGITGGRITPGVTPTFGGIPVVTSEAVPKDEAWLVDPAKIKEFLGTDEGKEILDKVKAPNPVVTTLMGKVESQTFEFPLHEPDYKGMYEDSRELVRKLTRAAVAVLTAPDGIDKASAYARLSEAVKEAL